MRSLKNKTALITGGGSGIGRAISEELAGLGATCLIHYHRSRQQAEELAETITREGGKAWTFGADLTDEIQVRKMVAWVVEVRGSLDVLVNNTGDLVARRDLEKLDTSFFRQVMAVNMDSMVMVTRESLPLLKDHPNGASIVNLASLAGRKGGHGGSLAYSTAKGAIITWTRALAAELAPFGIRANALAPGLILGSRFHEIHTTAESKKSSIAGIPVGRAGSCEDVARAAAFLASETDGFITGATLDINGGVYMA